jgi:GTPase
MNTNHNSRRTLSYRAQLFSGASRPPRRSHDAGRTSPASKRDLPIANHAISNRYYDLLEPCVKHRKQTTAPRSNRYFFGLFTSCPRTYNRHAPVAGNESGHAANHAPRRRRFSLRPMPSALSVLCVKFFDLLRPLAPPAIRTTPASRVNVEASHARCATQMTSKLPSIVIVGRPNVGKSTLFNRLTGTRRSIVTNEPGITRDRIYGTANWEGRSFEVVDTGGIVPEDKAGIPGEILRQASVAIKNAARVVQIVDGRVGPTPLDQELAQLLRRAGKPPLLAVNKVDTPQQAVEFSAPFYELGDEVFPISAEHGFGVDVLLDAITEEIPKGEPEPEAPHVNIAIIGRPNVGKSTLLNQLVGAERSIVSAEPGTTRDAVDTVVERNGKAYRFLDTAGIRRKGKTKLIAEKLSVIMARQHLERADIALLVADSAQGITSHDATIASYAEQSGRSVIIVMNKWDLALEAAQDLSSEKKKRGGKFVAFNANKLVQEYEPLVRARLKFLSYAPIVFLSAKTGENIDRLYNLIDKVVAARNKRISTGELNRWVAKVDLTRGTSPASREVKIFYITQASTAPPTFVLFTNQLKPLHFSYQRFLENELRKEFGFLGTPIRFTQRLKKRGSRHRERKDPRKP